MTPFWVERSVADLPKRLCDEEFLRSVEELGRSGGLWVGLPTGELIGDIVCD